VEEEAMRDRPSRNRSETAVREAAARGARRARKARRVAEMREKLRILSNVKRRVSGSVLQKVEKEIAVLGRQLRVLT